LADNDLGVGVKIVLQVPNETDYGKLIRQIQKDLKGRIKVPIEFDWTKKSLDVKLSEMRTYLKKVPLKVEIQAFFNQGALNAQLAGLQNQINKVGLGVSDIGTGGYVTYPGTSGGSDSGSSGGTTSGSYAKLTTVSKPNSDEPTKVIKEYDNAVGSLTRKIISLGENENSEITIQVKSNRERLKSVNNLKNFVTELTNTKNILEQKLGWKIDVSAFGELVKKAEQLNATSLDTANEMKKIQIEAKKLTGEYSLENQELDKIIKRQETIDKELKKERETQKSINALRINYTGQLTRLEKGSLGSFLDKDKLNLLKQQAKAWNTLDKEAREQIKNEIALLRQDAQMLRDKAASVALVEKQLNTLNNINKRALGTQTGIDILPKTLPGKEKLLKEITDFRNQIAQIMSNVKTTGEIISPEELRDLDIMAEKIRSLYRIERENAKDSKGFTFQKYEAFTKLNPAITDVTNKLQLENTALIENARLIRATASETENFVKVSQQLLQGSTKKDLTIYIDKKKLADGTNQIYKVNESLRDLKVRAWDVGSVFKEALQKVGLWAGATGIFYGVANSIQQVWVQIVEVNKQLTELSKVLSNSTNWVELMDNMTLSANYYARSITEAMNATLEFGKQGYEAREAVQLANSALLGANVTGMSAFDVSEKLTGALAQFNIEAKNSAQVIDKVNEVKLSAS